MPQIIAPPKPIEVQNESIETVCPCCHYTISYTENEIERVTNNAMGVFCPQCHNAIEIEYVEPFTFPKTFYHFGDNSSYILSDEEIQKYVNVVKEKLQRKLEVGEYTFTGTGNVMVFGFKLEDEDCIYVAKDYWEDSVFQED